MDAGGGIFGGIGRVIPAQDVAQVSQNWPAGNIGLRLSNYMVQAQQKWTIAPVANAGGYPGSPYFKITIAGTDRALAATDDAELVAVPAFTGAPEQLWRIEQLTDGTYRIMPKAVPNSKEPLVLSAVGSSFATLASFDSKSDKQRWNLKTP
jgi:arabinan endo-1,5-alpha-L-arabinosidase